MSDDVRLFTAVNPERLHDVWDWVRPRLERVIRKNDERGWLPEDVYHSIKCGASTLCTIGEDEGIIVFQRQVRAMGPVLFVWILEGEGIMRYNGRIVDELRAIARSAQCNEIVMHSGRDYRAFGFKPGYTIYSMEV
jgi:hypothetical protein